MRPGVTSRKKRTKAAASLSWNRLRASHPYTCQSLTMFVKSLFAAAALAVLTGASPVADPHVVHERRSSAPLGWAKRESLEAQAALPISIALAQENLDKGYDWLMDVSHPASSKYGQHWNVSDIAAAFAPRFVFIHFIAMSCP